MAIWSGILCTALIVPRTHGVRQNNAQTMHFMIISYGLMYAQWFPRSPSVLLCVSQCWCHIVDDVIPDVSYHNVHALSSTVVVPPFTLPFTATSTTPVLLASRTRDLPLSFSSHYSTSCGYGQCSPLNPPMAWTSCAACCR